MQVLQSSAGYLQRQTAMIVDELHLESTGIVEGCLNAGLAADIVESKNSEETDHNKIQ